MSVNDTSRQLRFRYTDGAAGLFNTGSDLAWLRVQLRGADNTVLGEANLWTATACEARTLCVGFGTGIDGQDAQAVAVDFFEASLEALEAFPGSAQHILMVVVETGTNETGFDASNGQHIGGRLPEYFFTDGTVKPLESLKLRHGGGRELELVYDPAAAVGLWRSEPEEYRKWRLSLRDRTGEELVRIPMADALGAYTPSQRRCGDATAQRRLCIPYAGEFRGEEFRGQVLSLQVEDITGISLIGRVPGGPVGGQVLLTCSAGCCRGEVPPDANAGAGGPDRSVHGGGVHHPALLRAGQPVLDRRRAAAGGGRLGGDVLYEEPVDGYGRQSMERTLGENEQRSALTDCRGWGVRWGCSSVLPSWWSPSPKAGRKSVSKSRVERFHWATPECFDRVFGPADARRRWLALPKNVQQTEGLLGLCQLEHRVEELQHRLEELER